MLSIFVRLNIRMDCHCIAFTWAAAAQTVSSQVGVVQRACEELQRSEGDIQTLLSMVLTVGELDAIFTL